VPEGENYIKGVEFNANLIVIDSKGIDVILRIDWMSKQKAIMDCAKKAVKLTTGDGQEIEYIVEPLITHQGATNQIQLNQLEFEKNQDVRVVDEYPDVFPEELLGLPPDHDIEFVIELVPRTAPIYKSPYRMSDKQLAELREQIQELQGKGYLRPS
jgi:hypothetical protein